MGGGAVVMLTVEPLRDSLLGRVADEIEHVLTEADERVAEMIAEAERRVATLLDEARAEGVAAASISGAHDEVGARRRARSLVLAARRELYDELGRRARVAAHALRQDPRYPAVLERLSATARAQLGDEAELEVDPADAGGVRAAARARRVDYTLDALVARCLAQLGVRVEELWE